MKRNEFKLLIENWKKNFITESDLSEISDDELKGDLEDYFDDGSFEEPRLDDLGHPSHIHSSDDKFLDSDIDKDDFESTYSSDSEEGINGFSGIYDDDPTYSAGDHSSLGQDDENTIDISDIENVNLFDLDEF